MQRIWKAARRRRNAPQHESLHKNPLFLGTDEEGGTVSRVGSNPAMGAKEFPSAQSLGEQADPAAVYQAGQDIGGTLHAIGFNMDFAPVADVSSGASAVIGSRSFGTDAQLCASLVSIMMQSLSAEEIVPCLKHFPGYGSAITDDHYGTSVLTKTQEELEACDFLPFSSGIASGAPFVMVSHLSVPEIVGDETPSDLSSKIVSDLLRNKLGFTGVIITDSHQMASITDHYTPGEAAVKALQAGVDMILMPQDLQAAFDGVKQALSDGTLTQARIDESVLRILQVKAEYNILQ
ncbi:MAG: glycoside hydrolase family 3 N-terminal domain-containing protein [Oscillospiraceae bacterium]